MKKINSMIVKAKNAMSAKKGEAYIDMVVKIVIIAVLGVVVYLAVNTLIGDDSSGFLGRASNKVNEIDF